MGNNDSGQFQWTTNEGFKLLIRLVILWLLLEFSSVLGQLAGGWYQTHRALDNIEKRVSLDQAFIDVGNASLNTPVNQPAVTRYLEQLNRDIEARNYPVRVRSIQGVVSEDPLYAFPVRETIRLNTPEQTITIVTVARPLSDFTGITLPPVILTALATPLVIIAFVRRRKRATRLRDISEPATPKLVINLNDKTIGNGVDDVKVTLQNKPLCFYTALIRYCIENPGMPLQHHKDVPEPLITLANRVFARLIELGHTKRKRPDFNANLDKTLSEVRAALDEVFFAWNDCKERYYPPRAQGEGSRSKQHSYALPEICEEDVEIIGK
ncbi:hypothetical protein [Alteromonas sp. CYL-A6]|uniref:hypothetical protein n=1 Tax=Alteromonas nitratireducens TaxID=3390813 RepID=UPI0034C47E15